MSAQPLGKVGRMWRGRAEGREREAVLEGGMGTSHAQLLSPQASSSPALPLVVL